MKNNGMTKHVSHTLTHRSAYVPTFFPPAVILEGSLSAISPGMKNNGMTKHVSHTLTHRRSYVPTSFPPCCHPGRIFVGNLPRYEKQRKNQLSQARTEWLIVAPLSSDFHPRKIKLTTAEPIRVQISIAALHSLFAP